MEPYAYVLRDHELFHSPLSVDLSKKESRPTPDSWEHRLESSEVEVLPLVADQDQTYRDGWCTYTYEHTHAPELEVICGGINAKTPKASGIWRQGFILHFGFEPSPSQLNENGKSLLINSISYVARFRDDRPIVRTPSPFYGKVRFTDRDVVRRLIENKTRNPKTYLEYFLDSNTSQQLDGLDRAELNTWYEANRPFLIASKRGKLTIDEVSKEFGCGGDDPEFLAKAVDALGGDRDQIARNLLRRYVPEGPGHDASEQAWTAWIRENRDYLFFTDTGGGCWLIDRLAKQRQQPTTELRGVMRADIVARLSQP